MSESLDRTIESVGKFVVAAGAVVLVVGGIYCLAGWGSKCARCEQWWATYKSKREKIKEEKAAKDVERKDKHFDKEGKEAGYTTRKERVYGKYITYRDTHACKFCPHKYEQEVREWRDY